MIIKIKSPSNNTKLVCSCRQCEKLIMVRYATVKKNKFCVCLSCQSKNTSKNMSPEKKQYIKESLAIGRKNYYKTASKEELSRKGKLNRSKVKMSGSDMVRKQWESIKNNPEKYQKAKIRLRKIAKDFHNSMNEEDKHNHYKKVFKNSSKQSIDFFKKIENLGFILEYEVPVSNYVVDAVIKDSNVILEYFGDTFHCNPRKYEDPTLYCSWIDRTVGEQWSRDRKRLQALYKKGFDVIVIWSSDEKNIEKHHERIKNALCKNRIY